MKPLSSVHIFRKARNGILNYNKSNNTIIKAKKKKKNSNWNILVLSKEYPTMNLIWVFFKKSSKDLFPAILSKVGQIIHFCANQPNFESNF